MIKTSLLTLLCTLVGWTGGAQERAQDATALKQAQARQETSANTGLQETSANTAQQDASASLDQQVADCMGASRWRELRDLYLSHGEEIEAPWLKVMTQFFVSHFYNRPSQALDYGRRLLAHYPQECTGSEASILYFMAEDLSRLDRNREAAELLDQVWKGLEESGNPSASVFKAFANQYRAIAQAGGFRIQKPQEESRIPLYFESGKREDPKSLLVPMRLNHTEIQVIFDTGAGVNVMGRKMAEQFALEPIAGAGLLMEGMGDKENGKMVMVRELALGGFVMHNVPFQVVDFERAPAEDSVAVQMENLNRACIVGTAVMMHLGEFCIDFLHKELRIPACPSPGVEGGAKFYKSSDNQLILSLKDQTSGEIIEANFDTGASSTLLTHRFLRRFSPRFAGREASAQLRLAGVGGAAYYPAYPYSWAYSLEEGPEITQEVKVSAQEEGHEFDCLWGLDSMTRYDCLRVNFTEMRVSVEMGPQ